MELSAIGQMARRATIGQEACVGLSWDSEILVTWLWLALGVLVRGQHALHLACLFDHQCRWFGLVICIVLWFRMSSKECLHWSY